MRYIYSAVFAAFLVMFASSVSTACEMRSVIRDQIKTRLANIEVSVDAKDLENQIHDMVHSQLDREKDRLNRERDKLRDERRKLERERRDLKRARGRVTRVDRDEEEDSGWGGSILLALGLYGAGLFLLTRRSRNNNGNTE